MERKYLFWNVCIKNYSTEYYNNMSDKQGTAFRLSEKARLLLRAIADEDGVAMTAVIEAAIRQIAKERGITIGDKK